MNVYLDIDGVILKKKENHPNMLTN